MLQIELLSENKLIICALGNLHYDISRAGLEIRRSEVRIPVKVQIFLLRSDKKMLLETFHSLVFTGKIFIVFIFNTSLVIYH